MIAIVNNNEFVLSAQHQQAIRNAAANAGIEEVIVGYPLDSIGNIIPIHFDCGGIIEYAFSLNTKTDTIQP